MQYERAAQAMQVAVSMRPSMLDAHRYLAALYMRLDNPDKAMIHRKLHDNFGTPARSREA